MTRICWQDEDTLTVQPDHDSDAKTAYWDRDADAERTDWLERRQHCKGSRYRIGEETIYYLAHARERKAWIQSDTIAEVKR
jgi:hypothetical protein